MPEPDPEPDHEKRKLHELLRALPTYHAIPKPSSQDCPGYLISQPEVSDALHAHRWWDKGQLDRLVGEQSASPWLNFYVDAVTSAVADLDEERERKREEDRRTAEWRAGQR